MSDGECFTHVLNPSTFLSGVSFMVRNIVFVIDVSGSMNGRKLDNAKASFSVVIDILDKRDNFTIQSFSDRGTKGGWGPNAADATSKDSVKQYVAKLNTIGYRFEV